MQWRKGPETEDAQQRDEGRDFSTIHFGFWQRLLWEWKWFALVIQGFSFPTPMASLLLTSALHGRTFSGAWALSWSSLFFYLTFLITEGGYYIHRRPAALEMGLAWFLVLPVRGSFYQRPLSFLIKPKHSNFVCVKCFLHPKHSKNPANSLVVIDTLVQPASASCEATACKSKALVLWPMLPSGGHGKGNKNNWRWRKLKMLITLLDTA